MKMIEKVPSIFQHKELFICLSYLFFILLSLFISFIFSLSIIYALTAVGYSLIIAYIVSIVYLYNHD